MAISNPVRLEQSDCENCGGPPRDSRNGRCRWCGKARLTSDQVAPEHVYVTTCSLGYVTTLPAAGFWLDT